MVGRNLPDERKTEEVINLFKKDDATCSVPIEASAY